MRTTMDRTHFDPSLPFSKRNFYSQRLLTKVPEEEEEGTLQTRKGDEDEAKRSLALSSSSSCTTPAEVPTASAAKRRTSSSASDAILRLRTLLVAAIARRRSRPLGLGSRVVGTLFGNRRGHVHLAFQVDARSCPVVLIEMATPTTALVREMSSGLVRVALECERKEKTAAAPKLVEEPLWRAYFNGKKCGYAVRRECGPADWKVLRAVEPVSMGAGVIPGDCAAGGGSQGDVMYMRARFERVVGSKDSEAFYMMNPDGNGGPELSVYFLRARE